MRKVVLALILTGFYGSLSAQKITTSHQQIWAAYANQTRLTNKVGVWLEGQLRTKEDFAEDLSTGIARAGVTYYLNDATKLTAGYAYVHHYPGNNHPGVARPEHRPWQQLQWHTKYPRVRLMQWLRVEERFLRRIKDADELAEGHNFNYRVRYNFLFNTPLGKNAFTPGSVSFVLNNEVHLNFGKEIVFNTFDQNRLFTGFNYHVNAHDQLQAGYLYLYQQQAAGNRYRYIHAARITYLHNLDLRRKESTQP